MFLILGLCLMLLFFGLLGLTSFLVQRAEQQYPPAGKFIEVEGIKLHYYEQGSGTPIVFLHGGILSGQDFEHAMQLAVRKGYHTISFDRPGYGHSERPQNEQVTPQVQARLLYGALKKLGIEKPIFVGHSWSGVLLLTYALNYPDSLSGMVTLGAGLYRKGYPAEKGDPLSKLVMTPVLGKLFLHTILVPLGYLMAGGMLRATFQPEQVPEEYAKATRALWFRPGQFKANREDVLAFAPACDAISGRYQEITVPTVIVIGEKDPFTTKIHSTWLHQELSYAKLFTYPKVAHMIPQNHPQIVLEAVEALH